MLALAIMFGMVFVADRGRRQADNAREVQVLLAQIRSSAQEFELLAHREARAVLVGERTPREAATHAYPSGARLYAQMKEKTARLATLAPGEDSDQIRLDVAGVYTSAISSLQDVGTPAPQSVVKNTDRFRQILIQIQNDVQAMSKLQDIRAREVTRRASIALFGGTAGGSIALLVLALGLARMRRRGELAEQVRGIERRSEERIRALVEHAGDVVTVVSVEDQHILWLPASVERMLGLDPEQALGRSFWELVHPDDVADARAALDRCVDRHTRELLMMRCRHTNGNWVWIEAVAEDRTEDPAVEGILLSLRDISERKRLEDRLRHQAYHDSLTGLANRALLEERLEQALDAAARSDHSAAVLYLDLDDFKTINDSLGHMAGDEVLRAVGGRVASVLRPGDLAARPGGDEFAVLLREVDDERAALAVAERLADVLKPDFIMAGRRLSVGASIGMVVDGGGSTVTEVMRNVDLAMYSAKDQGSGQIRIFEEELHRRALDRLELGGELQRAVDGGEFFLEYQPIVDLESGRILGMEALTRWQHPLRGRLAPDQFIGLAEQNGAIIALGGWVLREACAQALELGQLRSDAPYVSVNVSIKQLEDAEFPREVAAVLAETGLSPGRLVLELTESLLVEDRVNTLTQLTRLKELGVRLAIDDFGVGYSVLSYLQEFPIDLLKIDRSFVEGLHINAERAQLVEGVVGLAQRLRLEVVAEGIEESAQADALRRMGAQLGQGQHFSAPTAAAAFAELLIDTPVRWGRR